MATVYLAGKMTGLTHEEMNAWRKLAEKALAEHGFRVLNPVNSPLRKYPSNREIRDNKHKSMKMWLFPMSDNLH